MLIITGTGRSGSSAIAEWLSKSKILPYESERIPQFYSGFEPKDVSRLNSAIWLGNDAPLQSLDVQGKMIKEFDYQIIKENSFFYGNGLDTWLSNRTDLKFLICLRNFSQVEKSRRKVNQLNKIKTTEELKLCFGSFLSHLIFKNIEYKIIQFPNFIDEHDLVYKSINELNSDYLIDKFGMKISMSKSKKIWNETMDKSLINF